uniref:Uncharacterized protein n=1 Tax=Sphaerodactylus townsendi TaxID=933632 RepID=A0ACB8EGG8_9SAUR
MDVCQIFTIVPKMSMDFLKKKNVISLAGCGIQMFFTLTMGGGECLLLTVMSYDSVLKLSCSEASAYENGLFVTGVVMLLGPISIILASYISILLTVLGMQSVEGRHKAFGTCISHLIVVSVFYGAASFKYMRPRSYRTPQQDKIVSVFCDIVTPTLNPLIYSLRNRDVLAVLRKWYGKCN